MRMTSLHCDLVANAEGLDHELFSSCAGLEETFLHRYGCLLAYHFFCIAFVDTVGGMGRPSELYRCA